MNIEHPQPLTVAQHFERAVAHQQAGQLADAERHYLAVLQADPDHTEANHNVGVLAVQMKQPAAGLPYLIKALEADPACGQYWLSYIDALFQANEREAALEVLALARQQGLPDQDIEALSASWVQRLSAEAEGVLSPRLASQSYGDRQAELAAALNHRQMADYYYNIEVSGGCNLRCPSCAVGNTFVDGPAKTLMKLDFFAAILQKICSEQAAQGRHQICLDLYNWGEPLLNPDLPKMVRLAKESGFKVGISTNLNHVKNLEELIRAEPGYIRISLSGYYQQTYSRTHKGGDIEKVKANMRLLREYLDKYNSSSVVVVGYITYKHNCTEDLALMSALCHELDFKFSRDTAVLMPLEKLLDAIENKSATNEVDDLLLIAPKLMSELSRPYRANYRDCTLRRARLSMNADGSVPLCCAVWSHEYDVAANYLDTSEEDIRKVRYSHDMCKRCMSNMADFTYNGIYVPPVKEYIQAAIDAKLSQQH